MRDIVCICGTFPTYDKWGYADGKDYIVSHGIELNTDRVVVLPNEHPRDLGAVYINGEWIIKGGV